MKTFLYRALAAIAGGCPISITYNSGLDVEVDVPNCLDPVNFSVPLHQVRSYLIAKGLAGASVLPGMVQVEGSAWPVRWAWAELLDKDMAARQMVADQIGRALEMLNNGKLAMILRQKDFVDMDMMERQAMLWVLRHERANPDVLGFVKLIWWYLDGHVSGLGLGNRPEVVSTALYLQEHATPLAYTPGGPHKSKVIWEQS